MSKETIIFIDTGEFIFEDENGDAVVVGNIEAEYVCEEDAHKMAKGPDLYDGLKEAADFLLKTFGPEHVAVNNDSSRWTDRGAYDCWQKTRDILQTATA